MLYILIVLIIDADRSTDGKDNRVNGKIGLCNF